MSGIAEYASLMTTLGLRARSGWATAIVLSHGRFLLRRVIVLADERLHGAAQPYHAIEKLALAEAEQQLARYTEATRRLARKEIGDILQADGVKVGAVGLLTGSGRPLPALEKILISHAMIHAAEGEFFREALLEACRHYGVLVAAWKEKEALAEIRKTDLHVRLHEIGKQAGRPWTQQEKLATFAALLAAQ
jgi:hypothetical protein